MILGGNRGKTDMSYRKEGSPSFEYMPDNVFPKRALINILVRKEYYIKLTTQAPIFSGGDLRDFKIWSL
jgi:hypothetical protein